jgi:hypothetical protein
MNAYTANKMTSASTVTEGQASAMIPVITARMPRVIRDVLSDLNMTVPFAWFAARRSGGVRNPAGPALDSIVIITDDLLQE